MGAQIIKILDQQDLSTRRAEALTGVSHSEFSRIRQATFSRFTIDRLMTILRRLGQRVEISVTVHPREKPESAVEGAVKRVGLQRLRKLWDEGIASGPAEQLDLVKLKRISHKQLSAHLK